MECARGESEGKALDGSNVERIRRMPVVATAYRMANSRRPVSFP